MSNGYSRRRTSSRRVDRPVYVKNTYKRYPAYMLNYLDVFKQIGKNVFVYVDAPQVSMTKDARKLADIAAQHPGLTMKEYVAKTVRTLRRATPEEEVRYRAAVDRRKKFEADTVAQILKERIAKTQRQLKRLAAERVKALAFLAKHGVEPLHG